MKPQYPDDYWPPKPYGRCERCGYVQLASEINNLLVECRLINCEARASEVARTALAAYREAGRWKP